MSKNGHIGPSNMSKNGHIGPIIHTHQNISNYITIVSIRIFYTCFIETYNQSHMSAFFSKATSSERRLPEYSVYLKRGSHDGVSNAQ